MSATVHQPPALDIDQRLFPDGRIHERGRLERRIVWNLIQHLHAAGFAPCGVHDGEEFNTLPRAPDAAAIAAMELIFNLDEATLYVGRARMHWIFLVLGNGVDAIADYGIPRNDDGFEPAMESFDAEAYA